MTSEPDEPLGTAPQEPTDGDPDKLIGSGQDPTLSTTLDSKFSDDDYAEIQQGLSALENLLQDTKDPDLRDEELPEPVRNAIARAIRKMKLIFPQDHWIFEALSVFDHSGLREGESEPPPRTYKQYRPYILVITPAVLEQVRRRSASPQRQQPSSAGRESGVVHVTVRLDAPASKASPDGGMTLPSAPRRGGTS